MNVEENWNLQAHNLTLVIDYCNLSVWRFTSYLRTSPSSHIMSSQIWSKRVACMHSFSNLLHPFSHLFQCLTVTLSRPGSFSRAPVLCPSTSPSITIPKQSTSAGTIWLMPSGQYTEHNHITSLEMYPVSRLRTAIQFYQNVFNDQTNFLIWFFSILDRPLVKHLVIFVAY